MTPRATQDGLESTNISFDGSFLLQLYDVVFGGGGVSGGLGAEGGGFAGGMALLQQLWTWYSVFAFFISALFIYGIIYSYIRLSHYSEQISLAIAVDEERWRQRHSGTVENRQWQEVQAHSTSPNPNDWKLAIIEADVMLEQMLEHEGFAGTTVADRLRSASTRTFTTVEDAWQAHRVRNQIAHGGSDFILTQRMAQTTITQYKKVFEEFNWI